MSIISKRKPKSTGVGYKIFEVREGNGLFSPIYDFEQPYALACWHTAEKKNVTGSAEYVSGFHVFKTKSGAKNHWMSNWSDTRIIRKVRYSGAYLQGSDGGARTVVARRMYIYKYKRGK